MSNDTQGRDWIAQVGKPAYEAIAEMVAALQADRDRLEELRDELAEAFDEQAEQNDPSDSEALMGWIKDAADEGSRHPLQEAAAEYLAILAAVTLDGEEVDEDQARERIMEDPLSLRIFGERTDGEWEATSCELLLTTGGPAVRIMGELSDGEVTRAWLEVQDWGKPWTHYFPADSDVLMAYVSCLYFGE